MLCKRWIYPHLLLLAWLPFPNAHAKLFRNAYVSFELPSQWECSLDGTEWICSSQFKDSAREAIIILTAKEIGPQDSFTEYEKHLKAPRSYVSRQFNKTVTSEVLHVKQTKISNQIWIDGFHLGSEIPSFYTRYLASIRDGLAILVTFSAHKTHFTKYSNEFFRGIQTLQIVATKGLTQQQPSTVPLRSQNETIGPGIGFNIPTDMMGEEGLADEESLEPTNKNDLLLGIALILLAVGGYFLIKLNQKGRRKKS